MTDKSGRKRAVDHTAYRERVKTGWQRRLSGLHGLIYKAANGDPGPLIEHFEHGGPWQVSEDEGRALAWLLVGKLKRGAHRPRGSLSPAPKNFAIACAFCLVRIGTRVWCRRHGYERAPTKGPNKAPKQQLIECAIKWVQQEFPQVPGKISVKEVDDFHEKLSMDVTEYVNDFMFEAKQAIQKIALE